MNRILTWFRRRPKDVAQARMLAHRFPEILEEAACGVCGARSFAVAHFGSKTLGARLYPGAPEFPAELRGSFPLVYQECTGCGAGRINPTPSRAWVDFAPPRETGRRPVGAAGWMEDPGYIADKRRSLGTHYRDMQLDRFRSGSGAVLDISCGSGVGLELLRDEFGWQRCAGVECDPQAVAAAVARGLEVQQGLIYGAELEPRAFDLVVMDNSLEHHWSPTEVLRRVREVLRPGGALFVVVPNFHGYAVELLGTSYGNLNWGHWHYFTAQSLHRLATATDFEVERIYSSMCEPVVVERLGGRPERVDVDLRGDEVARLPVREKVLRGEFLHALLRPVSP